jgi:thiol-disulfide isomerase/thioredoxin
VTTTVALAAAIATVVVLSDDDDEPTAGPGTIELTPEGDGGATFTEFDGADVALSSLEGGPVIVNFFASDCTPCITEMPAFEEVHQELGDEVTFLGLAVADRPEDALDLVERTGVTYRTAQDKDASVISTLGATVLPTTVLLGSDGEVLASHSGEMSADDLRDLLEDELGITA